MIGQKDGIFNKEINTMIVLKFLGPDGKFGFTEANNPSDAVKMAKCYKQYGYRLLNHYRSFKEEK